MGKIIVKDTFVIKSILETNVKFKDRIIVYGQIIAGVERSFGKRGLEFIGNSLITVDSTESTTQESRPGSGRLFRLMRNLATEKAKGGRWGIS